MDGFIDKGTRIPIKCHTSKGAYHFGSVPCLFCIFWKNEEEML